MSPMLMLLLLSLLRITNVQSQDACVWSNTFSPYIGEYSYNGDISGWPKFVKQSDNGNHYLKRTDNSGTYIIIEDGTIYAKCQQSTDTPWPCVQNEWLIASEPGEDDTAYTIDPEMYVSNGSCPEWDCDAITTYLTKGCDIFNNKVGRNVWSNQAGDRYFWFSNMTFRWYCTKAEEYTPDEPPDSDFKFRSEAVWRDMGHNNIVNITFNSEIYSIECIKDLTILPTVQPTVYPTNIPSNDPTKYLTPNPTSISTFGPFASTTNEPSAYPSISATATDPSLSPTQYPFADNLVASTMNPITSNIDLSLTLTEYADASAAILGTLDGQNVNELDGYISFALAAAAVVLCSCFCCMVCLLHKRRKKKKLASEFDIMAMELPKTHDDVNKHQFLSVMDDTTEIAIAQVHDESESDDVPTPNEEHIGYDDVQRELKYWLENVVDLGQYLDNFIKNGYPSLEFVTNIKAYPALIEIGIISEKHQKRILTAIRNLETNGNDHNIQYSEYDDEDTDQGGMNIHERNNSVLTLKSAKSQRSEGRVKGMSAYKNEGYSEKRGVYEYGNGRYGMDLVESDESDYEDEFIVVGDDEITKGDDDTLQ